MELDMGLCVSRTHSPDPYPYADSLGTMPVSQLDLTIGSQSHGPQDGRETVAVFGLLLLMSSFKTRVLAQMGICASRTGNYANLSLSVRVPPLQYLCPPAQARENNQGLDQAS